ncbi:spondin domain-containing protein [Haladaptatus salinisoli]|uniref:spondin domain-containing protein n=1 Tax=Haladaptatus salinisoli TaxID=2884876 RepID=UPI001D0A2C1F|nr:spondin domain-containing protein [Haladaptatus salinisoli]
MTDSTDSRPTPKSSDRSNRFDRSRRTFLAAAGATALGAASIGSTAGFGRNETRSFAVRLENVSTGATLATSADGELAEQPVPLSPGAYAVHRNDEPIFTSGEPERNNGLEEVAEDGNPERLASALAERDSVAASGAFTTPTGSDEPSPLPPGEAYEFEVETPKASNVRLSLVTMFVPSNDLFFALGGASGMRLFDGNDPVSGDVSKRVSLWDAGTEINEEPGTGPNQAQRQRAPGVGLVERGTVAPIADVNGYDYPDACDVLQLTIEPL